MSNINLSSKEWLDLVFEGRNKDYGAYDLRTTSNKRHIIAMIMVTIFAFVAFTLPILIQNVIPQKEEMKMTEVTALSQLDVPEEKPVEKPLFEVPPPPPLKSSIKFTAPVIKKDEEVVEEDEMKAQEEILNSQLTVSIADIQGTDEEEGQDIAELREVLQEEPATETIFEVVEQAPEFPGGNAELLKYLSKSLRYPVLAQENSIQGRVIVQFVVSKTGDITDVVVFRGVDPALDREAIRVVQSMPKWIPGRQRGTNVNVRFTLPVTFKLQ